MYAKLVTSTQGMFDNIETLKIELSLQLNSIPETHTKELKNVQKWLDQLDIIIQRIHYLRTKKLPEIESDLSYTFRNPGLFLLSLFQPSAGALFTEIKHHSIDHPELFSFDEEDFHKLMIMPENSLILAWVGDRILDLVNVHMYWDLMKPDVGDIDRKRSQNASNEALASICDQWDLYEKRIHVDPFPASNDEKVEHTKGTLIESIIGVMYLESGLEQVISSLGKLNRRNMK